MEQSILITNDDLIWLATKIREEYNEIKNLDSDDKGHKHLRLAQLAQRFKLTDILDEIGYMYIFCPLSGSRKVEMLLPKDSTADDMQIIVDRLTLHAIANEKTEFKQPSNN